MSYILDALKKSDRERKQGEIPGLQSDHGARHGRQKKERKSPLWIWLAAGSVLGLAALALYWGMQRSNIVLQEKLVALENSVGQLKKQPGVDIAPQAGVAEETLSQPMISKGYSDAESTIASKDGGRGQIPAAQEVGAGEAAVQPSVIESENTKRLVATSTQQPGREEKIVIKAENISPKSQTEPVAVPSQSVAPDVGAEAETLLGALPFVQDLPSDVQKILPPLKVAGHVYAKDAAKRMVMINNRICREGDLVENQLYLEQIVWEGVVLRYQEIRFRMNLL
jgi:general secretion pathway protein B